MTIVKDKGQSIKARVYPKKLLFNEVYILLFSVAIATLGTSNVRPSVCLFVRVQVI